MKKIKFLLFGILCLISSLSFSQGTYTSGLTNIVGPLDGQMDINTSTDIVTLTLIGPDGGWLAMAFGVPVEDGHLGQDLVMFDGINLQDRQFTIGTGEPDVDTGGQNWTVITNDDTTIPGTRTLVATRARVSPDPDDYVFSDTPTSLKIAGAYNGNFTMSNRHDDRDYATFNFALLGLEDANKITFSMAPNPATTSLKLVLPSNLNNASIEIFDMLARKIYIGEINNTHFSLIDVSTWSSGVYLVKVSNGTSTKTKRFVKQ